MRSRPKPRSLPKSVSQASDAASAVAKTAERILGIDTALRHTGVGVVDVSGPRPRALLAEVLHNTPGDALSVCLLAIESGLNSVIERTTPDAVAIESIFFFRNARTALLLGHARGVAIATCARHGIPVFAYEPRRVKQAIVGYGAADKSQVQRMVASLLSLDKIPPEDAADALALALCHWHTRSRPMAALTDAPL